MNPQEQEQILARLMNNKIYCYIDKKCYIIKNPTLDIISLGQHIYNQTLSQYRFKDWLTDNDCLNILLSRGLLTVQYEHNQQQLIKRIENTKVDYYKAVVRISKDIKTIRKQLDMMISKLADMYEIRHMFDIYTVEGFAFLTQELFVLAKTIYDSNNCLLWDDNSTIDYRLLNIKAKLLDMSIGSSKLREFARSDYWRLYWKAGKPNPFHTQIGTLTAEQKLISMYSAMYDQIYEHSECPGDNVINDDDALDGWMIMQRQTREQDKKEKQVERSISVKQKGADEIFLMAKDTEDAKQIYALNSAQNNMISKRRMQAIEQAGTVKEIQLPDRQIENYNKLQQATLQKLKG